MLYPNSTIKNRFKFIFILFPVSSLSEIRHFFAESKGEELLFPGRHCEEPSDFA